MDFGKDYQEFVREHCSDDPSRLRFKFHGDEREWVPYAINNIAALKKKRKFQLPDGTDLTPAVIPTELSAQQSTSAAVASLHASLAGEGRMRILDMTFGLGMDASLLSRNPDCRLTGFDLQEVLVDAARSNFAGRGNVEVFCADSVEFLNQYSGEPFDLVFIDPARRGKEGERLYNLHDCAPDLTELLPMLRLKSRRVMAKLSPMLDVTQTIRDLPGIRELHVVEEDGECKELLAMLDFTVETSEPEIEIDRFAAGEWQSYSFLKSQENLLQAEDAAAGITSLKPEPGIYLLEPSAATMKAAPFNLLSRDFGIGRLHPNTQIYLSAQPVDGFPGRQFEIQEVWPFASSVLKRIGKEVPKADITLRNFFGFTPEELRKRTGIRPGGGLRLYATSRQAQSGQERLFILVRQ